VYVLITLDTRNRPTKEIFYVHPDEPDGTMEIQFSRWGSPVAILPPAT